MNNGKPISQRKAVQFMVALTILAWATQTLFHSNFGKDSRASTLVTPGNKTSKAPNDLAQGKPQYTDRVLDVAIEGDGFFQVQIPPTLGVGYAYTRNGNFFVNPHGELVAGLGQGHKLIPTIIIPRGTTADAIGISRDGVITVTTAGSDKKVEIGQLKLSLFTNAQGLHLLGDRLYQQTDASGPPIDTLPQTNGAGSTVQKYLEESNANPVK